MRVQLSLPTRSLLLTSCREGALALCAMYVHSRCHVHSSICFVLTLGWGCAGAKTGDCGSRSHPGECFLVQALQTSRLRRLLGI